MAATFPVRLVTPTGVVFEGDAEQVIAVNPRGEFGVLAQHINFITSLTPCVLRIIRPGGSVERWIVTGGLAEVKDGVMTILADSAESPASVNRSAAESDHRAGMQKLSEMNAYEPEYLEVSIEVEVARVRTEASAQGER